jgi:hypothetical protein
MLYNYNNYNFDIIFNSDDFIIQIEDTPNDNKLYSNIFTFEEIKNINNYFNKISIIEKLIKYCFDKKENYVLNIIKLDIIKLEFIHIDELTTIELKLDIFPIRKDLSTNAEIITLKKHINYLENNIMKIINNFIFHDNLTNPINLSYKGPICLSNINAELINLIFVIYYNNIPIEYLINGNIDIIKIYYNMCKSERLTNYETSNVFINVLNNYRIKNYNFNIIQEHLKLLQSEYIIFYKINITDKIINELNDNIIKIIFVECLINVDNLYNNKINDVHFYICTIENMNGFKIMNMISNIYFYCTPDDNINKNLFSPLVNFTNNYINSNASIILI